VYLRSFEADPNADAERRALALLSLPAMKLLHLTLDRLLTVDPADVAALAKRRRGDPGAFEPRLALMRGIDERRGFSQTFETSFAIANGALARLVNDIRPPQRRMSPEMLDRDLSRAVARAGGESRRGVPRVLMHLYADAATQDLEDYLDQLDSAAMRWLAGRERAALSAVLTTQFAEAEEEIVALFRKVRREALGVDAPPDVAGFGTREALQALIDAHGKPPIIAFVLARRGGEITVAGPRGIASRFGRPPVDAVDARTLTADLEALGLDAQAFAAALQQHLVDNAYRDRRLTARAERSRLIAALRAQRRAQLRAAEARARRAPREPAGDPAAVSQ